MNLPISSWAIRNPIPVVVAFTLMLVAGAYSYSKLPVKQFPNISFPMVVATVIQEGAAPTELENQVTRIVENELATSEPSPQRDVLEARRVIADLALDMAGRGEIELNSDQDDDTYIR